MRKLLLVLLAVFFLLSLTITNGVFAEEEIVLRFLMFEGSSKPEIAESRQEYLDKYFFPDHPNVKIEYEFIPFSDMEAKTITSFAGGIYYDLMIVNHPALAQYIDAGMLLPLDDYLQSSGIVFSEYFSASIAECGVFDNVVYSIPRDTDTRVLAVNKKLFADNGLEYPETTEDMIHCAKELLQDTDGDGIIDQFGILLDANSPYHPSYELGQFLLGNGVKVFTKDDQGRYYSQADTEGAKKFMEFSKELAQYQPNDFISYDGDKILSLFCQGKVGMYIYGSWNLTNPDIQKAVEDGLEYDLILNPAGTDHSGASQGGYHYGISSQTKHPDICWKVLEAFNKPDAAARISYSEGGLPTVLEAYNYPPFDSGLYDVIAEQVLTAEVPTPQISPTNEILTEVWYNAWVSVILGESTVEDALALAHEEITNILDEFMSK